MRRGLRAVGSRGRRWNWYRTCAWRGFDRDGTGRRRRSGRRHRWNGHRGRGRRCDDRWQFGIPTIVVLHIINIRQIQPKTEDEEDHGSLDGRTSEYAIRLSAEGGLHATATHRCAHTAI